MAYLLLAVGALMAVFGFYAGVSGYRIVQVEEGWSAVIAGSVLFAGGILTMALGLVLRTLTDLKSTIVARPLLAPLETDMYPEPTVTAPDAPAPSIASDVEPKPIDEPRRPSPPLFGAPVPDVAPEPEPALAHDDSARHATTEDAPSAADEYRMETPSSPEHDLVAKAPEPEAPPSAPIESDWLDRALADLDQELPRSPAPVPRPPRSGALPKAEPFPDPKREPAVAEAVPAPTSTETALAPVPKTPPAPEPAAPPSAVIGRYEADGTTYVMFADGSIEAQSPNGVYRFASMAELKSFIES